MGTVERHVVPGKCNLFRAIIKLPENLIWTGQKRVPAACEKCQCARKSHSTQKSKI